MFDYGASIVSVETVIENLPAVQPLEAPLEAKKSISEVKNVVNSAIAEIPTNNLTASTIYSDIASNDNPNNSRTAIILIISAVFIGASAYGIYFIRQKRVVPQSGSDFEVLDE